MKPIIIGYSINYYYRKPRAGTGPRQFCVSWLDTNAVQPASSDCVVSQNRIEILKLYAFGVAVSLIPAGLSNRI
jgi:hypothetical protein